MKGPLQDHDLSALAYRVSCFVVFRSLHIPYAIIIVTTVAMHHIIVRWLSPPWHRGKCSRACCEHPQQLLRHNHIEWLFEVSSFKQYLEASASAVASASRVIYLVSPFMVHPYLCSQWAWLLSVVSHIPICE